MNIKSVNLLVPLITVPLKLLFLLITTSQMQPLKKTIWLKSRANWDAIDQACKALNISEAILDQHPMHKLNSMLMLILERHIPRKVIKIRTNNQP